MLDAILSAAYLLLFIPLAFQFSIGCCCESCDIGADTFPTNGSGAPSGWTTRTGSVDVTSGKLTFTTANSLVLFDTAHPDGIAAAVITADVEFSGDSKLIMVFDHDGSDDDNFYYVQVERYTLGLYQMVAGTPTLLRCVACDATGGPSEIVGYFDGETTGMFAATCGTVKVWTDVGTGHTGDRIGLGCRSITTGASFDNFVAEKYSQDAEDGCQSFTPPDCNREADNFNRPDNADPGCPWSEISGTSAITSNKFQFTAAGRARFTPSMPTGAMSVTADVSASATNGTAELVVGGNSGLTTYRFGRLKFSGASSTITVGTNSGTLDNKTVSLTVGNTYSLTVTHSRGRICATVVDDSGTPKTASGAATVSGSTSYAGAGASSITSGNVTIENFQLTEAYDPDDHPTCARCGAVGPDCSSGCCGEGHTQMVVDIGSGLTDKTTCAWCSQLDGEFTATGGPCTYFYCLHSFTSGSCNCSTYNCDTNCADGGFPDVGPTTQNCHSGDSTAATLRCNGIRITVTIEVDSDNKCYLKALVTVVNIGTPISSPPCVHPIPTVMAEAYYETEDGADVAPCNGDTYTLNLYSGSLSCSPGRRNSTNWAPPYTGGCNGSFPSTITVRSVA